jgi:hypothetical protein
MARLKQLLSQLGTRGVGSVRFPKVHPAEISKEFLETLAFHPAGGHSTLRRDGAVRLVVAPRGRVAPLRCAPVRKISWSLCR